MADSADIRFLLVIQDSGSLTAASRKLGLSPSAVTQRLQQLEKKLATRLVDRTARTLRFTEEGPVAVPARRRPGTAVRRAVRTCSAPPRSAYARIGIIASV
ncbi:LysR family transcriptional regulator [Burkholderia gladioli]|nr:LysR family transcriptional regulator [Burkholderia gladioli]MDN7465703.1 LysR family transcriptional regulator [Burkholderia gladioli]